MHMNTPDISKVIFSVLAGHGSVSLLSVGSLHTVRVPASFNDDGTIEPPRHVVEYSNDISDELSVVDMKSGVAVPVVSGHILMRSVVRPLKSADRKLLSAFTNLLTVESFS